MLIPRFSLQQLLVITTASSIFFYAITMATRGHQWALAVSMAIGSVLLVLVVHTSAFVIAWLLALVGRLFPTTQFGRTFARTQGGRAFLQDSAATSPFADASPPPQFIPPPEDTE